MHIFFKTVSYFLNHIFGFFLGYKLISVPTSDNRSRLWWFRGLIFVLRALGIRDLDKL